MAGSQCKIPMTILEIETAGPKRNAPPHNVIKTIDAAIQVFPKRSQVPEDAFLCLARELL